MKTYRNINYANYFNNIMFGYENRHINVGEALTAESLEVIHHVVNGNRYID